MGVVKLVVCLLLFSYAFAEDPSVKLKMEEGGVVSDVIDIAPNDLLQVTYPSGVKADLGNELTPRQVKDIPSLNWNADDNALYTVLLTDPDAPSHLKEFRHWLIVNIPGNKVSEGKTVYDYISSGPPKGTGLHRYIFLVFKQQNSIETDVHVQNNSREGRTKTKARELIEEYNFGVPVAGNYFRAQFDDYVPILHARLGGPPPKRQLFQ